MSTSNAPAKAPQRTNSRHRLSWILIIPFIAMLFPQLFNFVDPTIAGVPFFYWYLLLWIPLAAFLTWVAYRG